MKKIVSLFLAAMMLLSCVSALAEIEITTEEITLTYCTNGNEDFELTQALAQQFMNQYPNITVNVLEVDNATYGETLGNWAATQELPDVYWSTLVTDHAYNGWALRLDEYYAKDEDATFTQSLLDHMDFRGRYYSIPMLAQPFMALLNKGLFERYNMELPSYDWDFDTFVQTVEAIAHPEDNIFGYGHNVGADVVYPRYGWDGDSYTFDDNWVRGTEVFSDWYVRGIADNLQGEEKIALLGDSGAIAFDDGYAAINIQAIYWGEHFVDGSADQAIGTEFLIYPVPGLAGTNPATMTYACISAACEHPEEAWELAKWMGWGKEAMILRNTWYQENEVMNMYVPVTDDQEVWDDLIAKSSPKLTEFYKNLKPLYPEVEQHTPYCIMANLEYFLFGINENLKNGTFVAADKAAELRNKYNPEVEKWYASWSEFADEYATATDLDITTTTDAE